MNPESKISGRWQFSLATLFVILTVAALLAGVFFGAFGEDIRAAAVSLLATSATYILPISTAAVLILLILGALHLFGKLFNTKT